MNTRSLALSYLKKAESRLDVLDLLYKKTEEYSNKDARKAIRDARFVVAITENLVQPD